jgi:hypothetical protein
MAKTKAQRKAQQRRAAVDRSERVGPTPETAAKLVPDPLAELLRMGLIDTGTKNAALEMAEVYIAVYGAQMPGARGAGGHPKISDRIAWIHKHRYLPWARKWAKVRLKALPLQPAVVDLVVAGRGVALAEVAASLADYAKLRKETPLPAPDRLAREAA